MVLSEGNMSLKNPVTPPGIDPGTVRLVAQRLNHYATPGPEQPIGTILNGYAVFLDCLKPEGGTELSETSVIQYQYTLLKVPE